MNPTQSYETIVCPATEEEPRHSEASLLQLAGGNLLLAWTQFYGGAEDDAAARISGKLSPDLGRTWGEPFVLQENDAMWNVMSASLLRLAPGRILLFYLRKNSWTDLQVCMRRSGDEGCTWGEEVRVTDGRGYYVMNNDRVVRLGSGRLLAPVSRSNDPRQPTGHQALCCISDDEGQTWRESETRLDVPKRGAMEPGVVELRGGRVLMIIRTQLGRIYQSLSHDQGVTWSAPAAMDLNAPEAPSSIARLPQRDLLLVWNNNADLAADHCGRRNPLTCAVSRDEGRTWRYFKNLEEDPRRSFAYTSIAFVGPPKGPLLPEPDRAVFTYYSRDDGTGRISLKLKSVPLGWFYG